MSEYTYLGVAMQEDEGQTSSVFQRNQASRLRKLGAWLRPFLSSKSIPPLARLRIFRSLVEPIARWGECWAQVGLQRVYQSTLLHILPLARAQSASTRGLTASLSRGSAGSSRGRPPSWIS